MRSAEAQVDTRLFKESWSPEPHWADTFDKPLYIFRGDLQDSSEDFAAFHWDSQGRIRFDRQDPAPPVWMGYKLLTIGMSSGLDVFDRDYCDIALAVAARLGSIAEGWNLSVSAGMGTANDGFFPNTAALYAAAGVELLHPLGPSSRWRLGLSLDGNRVLLPNVPLPYVAYENEEDAALRYSLGTLRTDLLWRPWAPLTLAVRWEYPVAGAAAVDFDLGAGFGLYTGVQRRYDGFHIRNEGETRLFYLLHTAEAGLRWKTPLGIFTFSGGYAFSQRFDTGYDLRDRKRLDAPEDRPMIALTVLGTF